MESSFILDNQELSTVEALNRFNNIIYTACSKSLKKVNMQDNSKREVKKGQRKVQAMPQSKTAALPRRQEEEETDKTKQSQIENRTNVRRALNLALSSPSEVISMLKGLKNPRTK